MSEPALRRQASSPEAPGESAVERLLAALRPSRRLFVLTGAGISTASGIPDYRDAEGRWKHRQPMTYREFVGSERARQRYWARSFTGWRRMAAAEPNAAHRALADLDRAGRVELLVTQNVDGLHRKAGSRRSLDLHGRLDTVQCLACTLRFSRDAFQRELARLNPDWHSNWHSNWIGARPEGVERPDGDVELAEARTRGFEVPACPVCGGVLKPAVVFFGEMVPPHRVERAFRGLEAADALLVVGSSLMVRSGLRFVLAAADRGMPVVLVNLGVTRADACATVKVEAPCDEVLPQVVARLAETAA